jgi:hypothetical protein
MSGDGHSSEILQTFLHFFNPNIAVAKFATDASGLCLTNFVSSDPSGRFCSLSSKRRDKIWVENYSSPSRTDFCCNSV